MNTKYIDNLPPEWEAITSIFAALGDKQRQTIMLLFEPNEEISLKTMVKIIPLSRSAIVHHLSILQYAGLVIAQKRGREIYYSPNIVLFYQAVEIVKSYTNSLYESQEHEMG